MPIIAQRTDVRKRPFCRPHRGWLCGPGGGFPPDSPPEEPSRARDPTSGRRNSMGIHSIGIHSIGMDTIPMECIRNGMDWYAMHCYPFHSIPMDSNRLLSAEGNGLGKTTNESGGAFTTIPDNSGNATNHLEVRTMLSCVAGGAQLEPPVHAPHTVYVKTLYRIAGQDYCRHHIIRAGAGPVVARPRE